MEFGNGIDFTESEVVEALIRLAKLKGVHGVPEVQDVKRVGLGRNIRDETGCSVGLRRIKPGEGQSGG